MTFCKLKKNAVVYSLSLLWLVLPQNQRSKNNILGDVKGAC